MNDDREERLKDKERRLRVEVITQLVDMGVEIQSLATLLQTSRMTIYRWLGDFFRPQAKDFEKIDFFLKVAIEVKNDWIDIVEFWNSRYHRKEERLKKSEISVQRTLYKKRVRNILNSKMDDDEKVFSLTALTFNLWAKDKQGEKT